MHFFKALIFAALLFNINSAHADIYEDAKEILSSENGTVKKWETVPNFVIVHRSNVDIYSIKNTIDDLYNLSKFSVNDPKFVKFDKSDINNNFYLKTKFKVRKESNLKTTGLLEIHGNNLSISEGSVFVFVVDPEVVSHFMIIASIGGSFLGLERAYVQKRNPCFFRTYSTDKSIHLGVIFISPLINDIDFRACLHEKFFQVMGLIKDSQGSESFNFDGLPLSKPTVFDEYILQALYNPEVKHGDPVEKVLNYFRSYLNIEENRP